MCLTQDQIEWAEGHDWFISSTPSDGVLVRCDVVIDGQTSTSSMRFNNFKSLRTWAGY